MIAVIQRVSKASIDIDGERITQIGKGLLVLLGVMAEDSELDSQYLVNKIINFRIFNDENDKMNLSIKEINGEILVVSQFTLCADWLKGRRPSFIKAAQSELGNALYIKFIEGIQQNGINTKTGKFGAMMDVSLVNEGPVTFVLDSALKR